MTYHLPPRSESHRIEPVRCTRCDAISRALPLIHPPATTTNTVLQWSFAPSTGHHRPPSGIHLSHIPDSPRHVYTAYNSTHTRVLVVRARSFPTPHLPLRPFSVTDQGGWSSNPSPTIPSPQFSNLYQPSIIIPAHKTVKRDKSDSTPRAGLANPRVGLSFIFRPTHLHICRTSTSVQVASTTLKRRCEFRVDTRAFPVTPLRSPVAVGRDPLEVA